MTIVLSTYDMATSNPSVVLQTDQSLPFPAMKDTPLMQSIVNLNQRVNTAGKKTQNAGFKSSLYLLRVSSMYCLAVFR